MKCTESHVKGRLEKPNYSSSRRNKSHETESKAEEKSKKTYRTDLADAPKGSVIQGTREAAASKVNLSGLWAKGRGNGGH